MLEFKISIIKQLLAAMTLLLSLLQGQEPKLGAAVLSTEQTLVQDIAKEQTDYFQIYKEYKPVLETSKNGYKYEVINYKTPDRNYGYQIRLRKEENGKIWERAESVGVEAENELRTYDWKIIGEIYDKTATSTQ